MSWLQHVRGRSFSLRSLLTLAIVVVAIPAVGFSAFVVLQLGALQNAALENEVRQRVDSIGIGADRELANVESALALVATAQSLQRADLATFRIAAARFGQRRPLNHGILLLAPDGTLLLDSLSASGGDMLAAVSGAGDALSALAEQVRKTGKPAKSHLLLAQDWRRDLIIVGVPIEYDGHIAAILATGITAQDLDKYARTQILPGGWIFALVDTDGRVLTRTYDPARFVGRPARAEFRERATALAGSYETFNSEGVLVYTAYRKSEDSGWIAAIGMARAPLVAPIRRSYYSLAAIGAGLLLLSLAVAAYVGWKILLPVRSLSAFARCIRGGSEQQLDIPAGAFTSVRELRSIGDELAIASRELAAAWRERERVATELRQKQKMETIGQLAAGVAHEVNNLLTIIGHNLHMVARENMLDDDRHITAAQRAVERGSHLTRQMLSFGRRQLLRPELCDLNAHLRASATMIESALGKAMHLVFDLKAEAPVCRIDRAELDLAIVNITINARDAMRGGGEFTISTRNIGPGGAGAGADGPPGGRWVCVRFADTGSGMPPDVAERAFDPFYTTKDVGLGSGLGLSQVYGFARQSGGDVVLETRAAGGTTVVLTLPAAAAPQHAPADRPGHAAALPAGMRATVLVVDDSPDLLQVVAEILESAGCHVLQAASAAEALALIEARCADLNLVLSDIVMPGGMSGIDLVNALPRICPSLAAVLMTGYSEHAETTHVILRKPFRADDLLNTVRDYVEAARD